MQDTSSEGNSGEAPRKGSPLVRAAVIVGIAILINVFLAYLVRVFYLEPEYADFCKESNVVTQSVDREACLSVGGQWTEPEMGAMSSDGKERLFGYCNEQFTCQKEYERSESLYNRNLFVVFIVAGVALLLGSSFLTGAKVVSSALSFGGVLAIVFVSLRYWSDMDDRLRVVVSGVALAALIVIAWKRFKETDV